MFQFHPVLRTLRLTTALIIVLLARFGKRRQGWTRLKMMISSPILAKVTRLWFSGWDKTRMRLLSSKAPRKKNICKHVKACLACIPQRSKRALSQDTSNWHTKTIEITHENFYTFREVGYAAYFSDRGNSVVYWQRLCPAKSSDVPSSHLVTKTVGIHPQIFSEFSFTTSSGNLNLSLLPGSRWLARIVFPDLLSAHRKFRSNAMAYCCQFFIGINNRFRWPLLADL